MRRTIVALTILLAAGVATSAAANPITMFNTGGTPGLAAANWTVDGTTAYVTGAGFPFPYWLANDGTSQWISPTASYASFGVDPVRTFVFATTFSISEPFSAAQFLFRMAADNEILRVRLNGVELPGVNWLAPYPNPTPFENFSGFFTVSSASAPFTQGSNTLQFDVNNWTGGSGNPTGLRVEFDRADVTPVAEPTSMMLLGTGLVGLAMAARRWRRKPGGASDKNALAE